MTGSDKLPQIEEIERVWYEMLNEITQQGVVSRFTADVATPSGEIARREVVRVGAYQKMLRISSTRSITTCEKNDI